jgi:hypothetical protein
VEIGTTVSAFSAIRRGSRKPGSSQLCPWDPQFDGCGAGLPVGRGSRCAGSAAPASSRHRRLRSDCRAPVPSGAEPQSQSSRVANRIGGLLHEGAEVHHIVGHRWFLSCVGVSQPDPTEKSPMTAGRSLQRYGLRYARLQVRFRCHQGPWRPAIFHDSDDTRCGI